MKEMSRIRAAGTTSPPPPGRPTLQARGRVCFGISIIFVVVIFVRAIVHFFFCVSSPRAALEVYHAVMTRAANNPRARLMT